MKKGFTLLELLIVVVIISVLAVIVVPQYNYSVEKARYVRILKTLMEIREASLRYEIRHDNSAERDIAKLNVQWGSQGAYSKTTVDNDTFTPDDGLAKFILTAANVRAYRDAAVGHYEVDLNRATGNMVCWYTTADAAAEKLCKEYGTESAGTSGTLTGYKINYK